MEKLLSVRMDDFSLDIIRKVAKAIGVTPSLRIERKAIRVVNDTLGKAQAAYQSKVPIYTGELREHILIKTASVSPFDPEGYIYVPSTVHESSEGDNKPTNSQLAMMLQSIRQKRSQVPSQAKAPFSPSFSLYSAGWMDEGFDEFRGYVAGI